MDTKARLSPCLYRVYIDYARGLPTQRPLRHLLLFDIGPEQMRKGHERLRRVKVNSEVSGSLPSTACRFTLKASSNTHSALTLNGDRHDRLSSVVTAKGIPRGSVGTSS
eukprot:6940054-Pyramimonas_sp.AAC.1